MTCSRIILQTRNVTGGDFSYKKQLETPLRCKLQEKNGLVWQRLKNYLISCASSFFTYSDTYVCILTLVQTIPCNWHIDKPWQHLPSYWNHVSVLYCSYSKVGTARTVTLPLFWAVPFAVLRIRSTRNNKWSSPQGSSSAWVYQYTCTKKIYSTFTLPNHDRITWTFLRCRQLAKAHVYP